MTPSAGPPPAPVDPHTADRRRLRRAWRIAGIGALAGVVLALVAGVLGATGRAGMAILLLVSALGGAVGAGYGTVTMLVDEWREQLVSRRRIAGVAALAALTAIVLLMAIAAG